ncbi:MAG: hypothetical protein U0414_00205 [Polyangiaceae bacterium]
MRIPKRAEGARFSRGSVRGIRSILVALALSTASLAGCMPPQGDTKMARGEAFTTGDPKYDEFFQEVLDAKSKVEDLDGTTGLKKTLGEGLGSKKSMSNDELFAAAKSKADSMKQGGGGFYVQMLPSAKLYKRGKAADGDAFVKAVEKTVGDGITRSDELSGMAVRIEQLEAKIDGLVEGAGEAFKDSKKKEEVVAELEGARVVLEKARLKALAESGRALNFVVELARNVDTGGADAVAIADAAPAPVATKPTGNVGRPVTKRVEYDH